MRDIKILCHASQSLKLCTENNRCYLDDKCIVGVNSFVYNRLGYVIEGEEEESILSATLIRNGYRAKFIELHGEQNLGVTQSTKQHPVDYFGQTLNLFGCHFLFRILSISLLVVVMTLTLAEPIENFYNGCRNIIPRG